MKHLLPAIAFIALIPALAVADELAATQESFRAAVDRYLWVNILADTITLESVGNSWQGEAALEARANCPFTLVTGWDEWRLSGFYGTTYSDLEGNWGTGGYLNLAKREMTGTLTIEVVSGTETPPTIGDGDAHDTAEVRRADDVDVGTVKVTLSVF